MNNFYLSENYIGSSSIFIKDINNLIELYNERNEEEDLFHKDDIYENIIYINLLNVFSQENQNILSFIEKLDTNNNKINNILQLNATFNDDDNAFIGLDFKGIKTLYNITNLCEYHLFKNEFAKKRLFTKNRDIIKNKLNYLYNDYIFHNQAISDIQQITQEHRESDFDKLFDLLDDIRINPHTGGLGKTEALKKTGGKCSKRLDGGERIIYSLKNSEITIYSFLGHYENL